MLGQDWKQNNWNCKKSYPLKKSTSPNIIKYFLECKLTGLILTVLLRHGKVSEWKNLFEISKHQKTA